MKKVKEFINSFSKGLYIFSIWGFGFVVGSLLCGLAQGVEVSFIDGVGITFLFIVFIVSVSALEVKEDFIDD